MYTPSFRDSLHPDIQPSYVAHALIEEEIDARKFGLPRFKKYPMPDAAHVRSAIKFFNYVTPANEAELARNILARMDEYGIDPDDINVGDNNRFKKYLEQNSLKHHGIKGMKWGVRRYQNADGTLTSAGKKRYSNTTRMYKDLKKQVHKQRAKERGEKGLGSGLRTVTPIGAHSRKYIEDARAKRKAYENSDAYKKWLSDYTKFQKKWDKRFANNPNYDVRMERQYSKENGEMFNRRPKKNFNDPYDAAATIRGGRRYYNKKYLNGAGKDLSVAYLRDLGYSEGTAKQMVDQLIKDGRTLGMD